VSAKAAMMRLMRSAAAIFREKHRFAGKLGNYFVY
jgi:hypothetical protein